MRRIVLLALAGLLGCTTSTGPSPLYSSYFLSTLDGKPLPVDFGTDGSRLDALWLGFDTGVRPRAGQPVTGRVRYTQIIRRPDQTIDHSSVQLNYTIQDQVLRIDLCPPGALCLVATELVGPVGNRDQLLLTHYLAGQPGSVYRFGAALPD
jgi:hypothetical protein